MKNFLAAAFIVSCLAAFGACAQDSARERAENQVPENKTEKTVMTENEARVIAEATCIKGGESLAPGYYNENSKTWWFDANLNSTKEGCNPACVVWEETKTAEINWRCTGLIVPEETAEADLTAAEELKSLFTGKYPEYKDTLAVTIMYATNTHARGGVSFEKGAPGGIFLAVRNEEGWEIVHEGNGEIPCGLAEYGFPAEMLEDCAQE